MLHFITHLALGGATETVLTCCQRSEFPARPAILCGATSAQEATLAAEAERMGIAVHQFPGLSRSINPLSDVLALRSLMNWMRRGQWDVIHTHGSKAGILGRRAAAAAGVPIIVHTVHGWGHHTQQNPLVRRLYVQAERQAATITDRIIVVADANREKGLADGIGQRGQYETIHSGIDIARFRDVHVDAALLRDSLGIPRNAPVVGTVGRLAKQKAPEDFVKMAAIIHGQMPDAHFVFVGGGPLQAQVESQVAEAGLQTFVHLLGYRSDVPELLRVFDVFALTSLWEGLPRVFAQAMCASLPIVATHVDGAAEAVRVGENGYLVPPRRPQEQAKLVLQLLNDMALSRKMGRRGLDLVDPQFCELAMVRRIEEIYMECARAKNLVPTTVAPDLLAGARSTAH